MTPNWIAVLIAGISAFVLGGVWYSPPLFGKAWMKENNLTIEQVNAGNKGKIFGLSLLLCQLMSVNLAMYLNTPISISSSACCMACSPAYGSSAASPWSHCSS